MGKTGVSLAAQVHSEKRLSTKNFGLVSSIVPRRSAGGPVPLNLTCIPRTGLRGFIDLCTGCCKCTCLPVIFQTENDPKRKQLVIVTLELGDKKGRTDEWRYKS